MLVYAIFISQSVCLLVSRKPALAGIWSDCRPLQKCSVEEITKRFRKVDLQPFVGEVSVRGSDLRCTFSRLSAQLENSHACVNKFIPGRWPGHEGLASFCPASPTLSTGRERSFVLRPKMGLANAVMNFSQWL